MLYHGYQLTLKRKGKDGSEVWTCVDARKMACKGWLCIKENKVVKSFDHSCQQNLVKNEIEKVLNQYKSQLTTLEDTSVVAVYKAAVAKIKELEQDLYIWDEVEGDLVTIQRKSGKILLHNGHQYTIRRKNCTGHIQWECVNRKKMRCRGCLLTIVF
ncbi:hypothetical protein evm_005203 [Chilo suppressalis]|nr:hypothetical protein evm_005203 [Chilo suppressalis]